MARENRERVYLREAHPFTLGTGDYLDHCYPLVDVNLSFKAYRFLNSDLAYVAWLDRYHLHDLEHGS